MFNDSIVAIMLPLIIHFLMWSGSVKCVYIHNTASQCPGSQCLTLSLLSHINNDNYLTVIYFIYIISAKQRLHELAKS